MKFFLRSLVVIVWAMIGLAGFMYADREHGFWRITLCLSCAAFGLLNAWLGAHQLYDQRPPV